MMFLTSILFSYQQSNRRKALRDAEEKNISQILKLFKNCKKNRPYLQQTDRQTDKKA